MPTPAGQGSHEGWTVVSRLLSGMVLYGGIGWLLARWLDLRLLFPLGLLIGVGLSTALVIFRYGRG